MSEPSSFAQLMRRVRAGDQEAATEIVRRYEPAIRRAVRFRLKDNRLVRGDSRVDGHLPIGDGQLLREGGVGTV